MTTAEKRAAFLLGEGTLTVADVRQWARELDPSQPILAAIPRGFTGSESVMVSVVPVTRATSSKVYP